MDGAQSTERPAWVTAWPPLPVWLPSPTPGPQGTVVPIRWLERALQQLRGFHPGYNHLEQDSCDAHCGSDTASRGWSTVRGLSPPPPQALSFLLWPFPTSGPVGCQV